MTTVAGPGPVSGELRYLYTPREMLCTIQASWPGPNTARFSSSIWRVAASISALPMPASISVAFIE